MQEQHTIPDNINCHYDALTLAREQLLWGDTIMQAIQHELERPRPDIGHLERLAGIGRYLAMMAAGDYENEAALLDEHLTAKMQKGVAQ